MKTYYNIEYSLPPHKTWELFHVDYSNMSTKRESLESLVRLRESYENDQSNKYRRSYKFRLVKLKMTKEVLDV